MISVGRRGNNSRQHPGVRGRAPHRRAARQATALIRQTEYSALSLAERLGRLAGCRGESKRERARLIEQIRVV